VHIGSDVPISTQVRIHTGKLNLNEWPRVHIEDNVWITCSCVISAGVTIGMNFVVAAGAVVVKK
jgi:acetyltransferase-like isoleucine patch superfamily enzyme